MTNIKYLPLLVCLGTGIAVSNTKAILEALGGQTGAFVRTPKYGIRFRGDKWRKKIYRAPESLVTVLELLMGGYSLAALILFLALKKYFISPFLLIYTVGFFYVFVLSFSHSIRKGGKSINHDV